MFNNYLTILEGQSLLLNHTHFNLARNVTAVPLVFTVSAVQGARFELVSNPGIPIFNFTQTQIDTNRVQLVSDRTNIVSYQVGVSCGLWTLSSQLGNVTFINNPPIVINPPKPLTQVEGVGKAFNFSFVANSIFFDPDGDPLSYMAQLSNGSALPGWLHFDASTANQLSFSGTAPDEENLAVNLIAQDPLNASISTEFGLVAVASNSTNIVNGATTTTQIGIGVGVGICALGGMIAAGLGFWRYSRNKNSRETEQVADFIRTTLNLKSVDNFDSEAGRSYVAMIHKLESVLKTAGIDTQTMRVLERQQLAQNVVDAARNKISTATDCLGRSVITVDDLNNRLQDIVTEVQILRTGGQKFVT